MASLIRRILSHDREFDEHMKRHRQALLAPDYASFESAYGQAAPPVLRNLYSFGELLFPTPMQIVVSENMGLGIERFLAMSEARMNRTIRTYGSRPVYAFAEDPDCNDLLIRIDQAAPTVVAIGYTSGRSPDIEELEGLHLETLVQKLAAGEAEEL